MRIELPRTALHGETDKAAAIARTEANHRAAYPMFHDEAQLAELDAKHLASLDENASADARAFRPSAAYAAHPSRPPPMPAPQCHVIAIFYDGDGTKLEIQTQDWEEAAALAARESLVIEV